jgi:two-component system, OmpR family, response regulator CpxR
MVWNNANDLVYSPACRGREGFSTVRPWENGSRNGAAARQRSHFRVVTSFPGPVLVIGSDQKSCQLLSNHLREQGLTVEFVSRGLQGLERLTRESFGIVVLDSALPDVGGMEVLTRIRARLSIPVLLLTGGRSSLERIAGLETGADDCLEKPFDIRELISRIKAILRRSYSLPKPGPLVIGGVTLDNASRVVTSQGTPIELTVAEFDLLELLLCAAGRAVTREEISSRALGRELSPFDRSIDNHVSRLRSKLGSAGSRIRTMRGVGYLYAC